MIQTKGDFLFMNYNIGILPTIIERHSSLYLIYDKNLILFLKSIFKKSKLTLINDFNEKKLNLIVSQGGNDLKKFSNKKKDKIRHNFEQYYLNYSIKNKIKYIGICYGAQFIANYFKSKLIKKKNHTRKIHRINFISSEKSVMVNSFHNFSVIKLGKNLKKIAYSDDGSIEAFKHNKLKLLGIMWHPERYKKIKKFDVEFVKKYL